MASWKNVIFLRLAGHSARARCFCVRRHPLNQAV